MYTAQGQPDRNVLLRQYSPLVYKLAHHMKVKLPANVEVDDLIQAGLIGLTEALSRFEAAQGVLFESFATQRIRGAMIDELRGSDWLSRSSRKSQKEIEKALRRLEHQFGRSPIESEIATELGLSLNDYQKLLAKVQGTHLLYLEDLNDEMESEELRQDSGKNESDPMQILMSERLRLSLVAAIKTLPEREQYVLNMHYEDGMNLKEIAAVLDITESRVSQLNSQAIARLRVKIRHH